MKTEEIRLLGDEELKTKLTDTRHELMNLRFQMITGQLTDTSRLKQTRRQIASMRPFCINVNWGSERKV